MVLRGHLNGGLVVLDEPASFPDGTPVEVTVLADREEPAAEPHVPSIAERYASLIGTTENLPEDAASQVDHYLYGHPKR